MLAILTEVYLTNKTNLIYVTDTEYIHVNVLSLNDSISLKISNKVSGKDGYVCMPIPEDKELTLSILDMYDQLK